MHSRGLGTFYKYMLSQIEESPGGEILEQGSFFICWFGFCSGRTQDFTAHMGPGIHI